MVEDNIFDIDIPSDDNDKKSPNTEAFFELTNIVSLFVFIFSCDYYY